MEREFVLACLAYRLDPGRPLPAAPPGLSWRRVYALLRRHKLAGLFYRLGVEQPGLWPAALQHYLLREHHGAALWGDRCRQEVASVLSALEQASIPVLVLKGWAVIPTVYGADYGRRTYGDIDLLVRPLDAARAEQALLGLGYSAAAEPWPGFLRRYEHSRDYRLSPDPGPFSRVFSVELHWALLGLPYPWWPIPTDSLFDRARSVPVAGLQARALGAEDAVVYTCGHVGIHHNYDESLSHDYELASVILHAGPALDWDAILARAAAWRLVLPVQRVLGRLAALWPGVVPAQVQAGLLGLRPTPGERRIHGWLERHHDNLTLLTAVSWLAMPGLGRRGRFLLESAFPGRAYMQQRYGPAPGGLWPVLYIRRMAAALAFLTRRHQN